MQNEQFGKNELESWSRLTEPRTVWTALSIECRTRAWDKFEFEGRKMYFEWSQVNILVKRFSFRFLVTHAMRRNRNILPSFSGSISIESLAFVAVLFARKFVIFHESFF